MVGEHVIAVDLGASSGRVTRTSFNGERFQMEEVHRFPNIPVSVDGTLSWDIRSLWREVESGIGRASEDAQSVGVDSWGVDFAFLGSNGELLSNPVHYRDPRTRGAMEWVFKRVPRREIFERTGVQFMVLNTLYQLASLVESETPLLKRASTYLGIPDLFNYWLCGKQACEYTHATTTQVVNARDRVWDRELISRIDIPTEIFPEIIEPGSHLGEYRGIPVIAPASHDTASAVVAVPTDSRDCVYLSSGTWSLMGVEIDKPLINDASYNANMTNEGGVEGSFRLLRNVMGLWLEQECLKTWNQSGSSFNHVRLFKEAGLAESFRSLIDSDDQSFLLPGDMPVRIRDYCISTDQDPPGTVGQFIRTIYESLAMKYRYVLELLISLTGRNVERIHVIGGGSQNPLLCQMTADSTGRPVVAGPVEATTLGNSVMQLIALGRLDGVAHAREVLSQSLDTRIYMPEEPEAWSETYMRFKSLIKNEE
jgi:rhamnulokinase